MGLEFLEIVKSNAFISYNMNNFKGWCCARGILMSSGDRVKNVDGNLVTLLSGGLC